MSDISPDLSPRPSNKDQVISKPLSSNPRRLTGVKGRLGAVALGILATRGGIDTFNQFTQPSLPAESPAATDSIQPTQSAEVTPFASPELTPAPSPETERGKYEREIEEKYDVELLNQKEGFERADETYDPDNEDLVGEAPPIRWRMDQLETIDKFLNYLPQHLIEPRNGKKFAISLRDYPSSRDIGGALHHGVEMITVNQDCFKNGRKKANDFSLFIHEVTHRNDIQELKDKVNQVLQEDMSFLQGKLFQGENKYHKENPDIFDAVLTLGSFAPGESAAEGRAGFAQLYVKGYERFMKAVGPVLYNEEFDPDIPKEELRHKYPKAHQIYDIYYNVIFNRKQYDDIQKELDPDFKYGKNEVVDEEVSPSGETSVIKLKEQIINQGVELLETDDHKWSKTELEILYKSLSILPNDIYRPIYIDGQSEKVRVKIEIGDKLEIVGEDKITIPQSIFNNKLNAFVNIGGILTERIIDHAGSREWIEKEFDIKSEPNPRQVLNDLIKLYLQGRSTFAVQAGNISDKFDSRIGEESNARNSKVYEFIKNKIFQGKEFDDVERELNPNFSESVDDNSNYEAEEQERIDIVRHRIQTDYNVNILDKNETVFNLSRHELSTIETILRAFPGEYFSQINGKKFSIVLVDELPEKRHDGYAVFITKDSLHLNDKSTHIEAVSQFAHSLIYRAKDLSLKKRF